ncbi:hypothetical protein D3C87_600950 [compost metagenome]
MAGFDLGSIIADATKLSGTQTQQAQEQSGLLQQNQGLANRQAGLISEAGNLTAQAELVKQQGELETQKARVQAANAFGTNVGDVSDIITQIGQSMRQTAIALVNKQGEVSEIEANSDLINNPLGWFNDLINGDAARSERDALAQQFDTQQKVAQGLNAQTQSTIQTQNAITETLSAASIQQTAEATKKLADAKALESKIQGNAYGANAIQVMREVGAQEFNRQMQVYSQVTEDQRWREGMALRKEQFEAVREQRLRGKAEDQYYVEAADQINLYRKNANLPEVTANQVRATLNQSGKIGEIMRDQQTSGFQIQAQGANPARLYGDTPSETVTRVQRDNVQLPPSFAPAKEILDNAIPLTSAEIQKRTLDPIAGAELKKDKAAQARIYDQTVQGYAKQLQSNVQSGKGNPYEVVPISVVTGENQALAQSKFGKIVLDTLVATGQPQPTPDMLLATAISSVEKGEISLNDARDGVVAFFNQAVSIKNSTGGFIQLGVPPQIGYNTKLDSLKREIFPSLSGVNFGQATGLSGEPLSFLDTQGARELQEATAKASRVVDLTKPTDVTLALTVMRSKQVADKILSKTPQ